MPAVSAGDLVRWGRPRFWGGSDGADPREERTGGPRAEVSLRTTGYWATTQKLPSVPDAAMAMSPRIESVAFGAWNAAPAFSGSIAVVPL